MPDRGERGPKGDHGQTGDIGPVGEIGETGDTGKRGFTGETGQQGEPGKSSILSRNVSLSFGVLLLVAFVVTSCQGYQVREVRKVARENKEHVTMTNAALCKFRGSLSSSAVADAERVVRTEKFIADIRSGRRPPIVGIPIEELEISLANQRRELDDEQATLKSLSALPCDKEAP